MAEDALLTFVSAVDHAPSTQMASVVRDVVTANRGAGLRLEHVDVDTDPERVVELGVMSYPALVLHVHGQQRGCLTGAQSKRAVLQLVLPEIHDDDNDALLELRRQLDSPGEDFPRRVLKRRERVTKKARVAMLGAVDLFGSLTKRQLAAIGAVADELVVDAGGVVTEQGRPGDQFFVVVDGSLTVRRNGRKIAVLASGDCFGEMSLLDGGPRSATVTAEQRCVLLAIDRMAFQSVLHASPELAIALLEVLSLRARGDAG